MKEFFAEKKKTWRSARSTGRFMLIVNSLDCLDAPLSAEVGQIRKKTLRTCSCRVEYWGTPKARGGTWRDREEK